MPPNPDEALPWKPILALCICNCAHFYAICSLFSYAGIMSADLGWAKDRNDAGSFAGFLQSANVLGRVPTSSLWGCFADRYGNKCGLICAMVSLTIGGVAFGLCVDASLAVWARFLFLGAGSGWVTFLGPVAMDIGGSERQAEVIGKVFASGTFIQLLGPAIGGWTYGIWRRFPAACPSMIGSVFGLVALGSLLLYMPTASSECSVESSSLEGEKRSKMQVLCTWPLPLLIFLRCIQGFTNFAFFEIVPLWAISSTDLGGLALTQRDLGFVLAGSALGSSLFMASLMPYMIKKLGLRWACVIGNVTAVGCFVILPACPGQITLTLLHIITNSCFGLIASSYISCINNVTPKDHRATVNGVCVTFESFAKGVGPLSTSVAFAWTLSHWGLAGHSAVFVFLALAHVVLLIGTLPLPGSIEGAKTAKEKSSPTAENTRSSRTAHTGFFKDPRPALLGAKKVGVTEYMEVPENDKAVDEEGKA